MARKCEHEIEGILTVAAEWKTRCLLGGQSIFGDSDLWQPKVLNEFKQRFVDHPIEGKEQTFFEKFEVQLRGGSPEVSQLAAELLWLFYLFPSSVKQGTKGQQIRMVWAWSGDALREDHRMFGIFKDGVGHPGTAFMTYRYRELWYLQSVLSDFKSLSTGEQQTFTSDPWGFSNYLDSLPQSDRRIMRHLLVFLLFPDSFERIASRGPKGEIVKHYSERRGEAGIEEGDSEFTKVDKQLLAIRKSFEAEEDSKFVDFYWDPWRSEWQGGRKKPTKRKLAWPWNEIFTDYNQAWEFFDRGQKWLSELGYSAEKGDDRLLAVSLPRGHKPPILRVLYGHWAAFGVRGRSRAEPILEYSCREDQIPEYALPSSSKKPFADNVTGHPARLIHIPFDRIDDERFEASFAQTLEDLPKLFGNWKANTRIEGHRPDIYGMFFDEKVRKTRLTSGVKETDVTTEVDEPPEAYGEPAYWWLNANPKIWDLRSFAEGARQTYTSRNQKGNPRQKQKWFTAAKPGDLVVGYCTSPDREVVALGKITKGLHDTAEGPCIEFEKSRGLHIPLTFERMAEEPGLKGAEPVVSHQGSLFSLSKEEYEIIQALIDEAEEDDVPTVRLEAYSKEQALEGLFLDETEFDLMLRRLKTKKNIILQGPPGVGKTFVAKRLAFALMGFRDSSRVSMIQFHQSYGYEEFIRGYRPDGRGGFHLRNGQFFDFCRRAINDPDAAPHVFIIDEINRGNLTKILGEVLMLIEPDKRGRDFAVPLAYSSDANERFFVPDNLYLIGMMNTADRSLSMVDYALRRRFAFIDLEPKFASKQFKSHLRTMGVSAKLITTIGQRMTELNERIAAEPQDLGPGFCIGHSFFCGRPADMDEREWFEDVVQSEIKPLLKEYWIDRPKLIDDTIANLMN